MVSFLEERSDEKSEVPFSEKPEDTVTMRIFGGLRRGMVGGNEEKAAQNGIILLLR